MNISHILTFLRDILLFGLLIVLAGIAYKRTYWYLSQHKNTIIHELERTFLHQIHQAQKQVRDALQILENQEDTSTIAELTKIQERIKNLEQKYQKNSPGLILLGPIATASIVFKEEQLKNELRSLLIQLGMILSDTPQIDSFQNKKISIDGALEQNRDHIRNLIRKTKN